MHCENCEHWIDPDDDNFEVVGSGKGFNPNLGPYNWFEGWLTCSECENTQWYSDSTI